MLLEINVVQGQVHSGQPHGQCQSSGKVLVADLGEREWSCDESAQAMWPNKRSCLITF